MERLTDVQNPVIKLSITATMSQAQIQTSAQVTTPEKYMITAAVSCNKRLNKTCLHSIYHQQETQATYLYSISHQQETQATYLHSISHQQETQATYLHSVQYIPNWVGYLGGFKKKKSSNSTTSFLL